MIGNAILVLLALGGYFGYVKAMHLWKTHLAERMVVLKEAEAAVLKSVADKAVRTVQAPMDDVQFKGYLDRIWVLWARTKGLLK